MTAIRVDKRAFCKRCHSVGVAWVQSTKTGRWYLAFAHDVPSTTTYSPDSAHVSPGGVVAHTHHPHDCENPVRGGNLCSTCKKPKAPIGTVPDPHAGCGR